MTRVEQRRCVNRYLINAADVQVWSTINLCVVLDIIIHNELEYIAAWILNPLDGRPLAKVIDWTFENTLENKEE